MIYGVLVLIALALTGGAYWTGRADGIAIGENAAIKAESAAKDAREETLRQVAEAISKQKARHVTIQQSAQREVLEVPVYRDCRITPVGMRDANAALAGPAASEPAGSGLVPRKTTALGER